MAEIETERRAPDSPIEALQRHRPRRCEWGWDEHLQIEEDSTLPIDLRIALAVGRALYDAVAALSRETAEPYRQAAYDLLAERVGIHERTLRRILYGQRWPTLTDLRRTLDCPETGDRLRARLRALKVDLLATRPNLSRTPGPSAPTGTVKDMEDNEERLLEEDIRTKVRVLASRQAAAQANHLDTEGQTDWLAVESALGRRWTPSVHAPQTITDQLRPHGLPLAGMVRTVLADGAARRRSEVQHGVMAALREVQHEQGLPPLTVTTSQITDALKYLRGRREITSDERGFHQLTKE